MLDNILKIKEYCRNTKLNGYKEHLAIVDLCSLSSE